MKAILLWNLVRTIWHYTSGSTGNPKGVMLTHRNITNYLLVKPENNYITDVVTNRKRVLGIQAVTFDISVCDVLVPLTHGLTYVFASDIEAKDVIALARLIKRTKVDAMAGTHLNHNYILESNPLILILTYTMDTDHQKPQYIQTINCLQVQTISQQVKQITM